ncbi:procollagen C-endopeptidase enhancer b isoform X1 [Pangasianodon hypophthalmus]|uniref:procollagen C-endopeptidase enhancer b isoform X1 n=1 Tax=Pangasianodon hypophthalmus TaxID=310915 RepID=UPI000EFF01B8|nr:procollagen C-endopeptidase enhancer b isoform X1 [Pangasianodon hypophthalmus]
MRGGVCVWCVGLLVLGLRWAQGQSQTNFTRPVFRCGGHLTTDSGFVASEDFPTHYKPNSKCTWYITVPEGHVVMLQFRIFDLEADPTCRYDYVDVYNGHSYTVQKLGRFCGTFRPGALISTSNLMMLEMVSDSGRGGRGFLAFFSGGKPHVDENQFCGGKLTKPQGSVKTPNWPDSNYPTGISCSWHISVATNMVIEVKFEKLDLETDKYCRFDYVALFNGGESDNSRRIGKFCGDIVPEPIVSRGNELLVQFVSDLSLTGAGFMAHYKSIPRGSRTATPTLGTVPGPRIDSDLNSTANLIPKPRTTPKPTARTKPTPKPKTTVKPKATLKPSSRPQKPKPARPTPKPVRPKPARPTPKPKPKPPQKPVNKVTPKPVAKPTVKPKAKPTPKPKVKPNTKPGVKATAKPGTKPAKPTPASKAKPKPKPGVKTTLKPKTKPATNTSTKITPTGNKKSVQNPECAQPCKRTGTLLTSFCPSDFVLTGKVTSVNPSSRGSVEVDVYVMKTYKTGKLNITKRGPIMSVTLTVPCSKCPALRKGVNYVLMGQVNEEGRGILKPSSFVLLHKQVHDKALAMLAKKAC